MKKDIKTMVHFDKLVEVSLALVRLFKKIVKLNNFKWFVKETIN